MECGLCGTLNRDLARFCGGCGAPLGRVCPTCKSEIDAGLRFCDQCGTEVDATPVVTAPAAPAPTPGAVRKTVTVLFADLGGSTGFGERTDPEIARQVLARYHAMLQQAVDAHGGTVAKFMGDGMMATFGIPEVAEDDAERAVRAGIEIQDRFARFAADIAARYGETLTARVGVNTGEVVIAAADADMVGDALNVAARLEKACRPGHVLVGEETWRLTRGVLAYESLGEVTVTGRAQPVGTYEISSVERRTAEPVAPFVGRESELARLRVAFDRAVADRSAVLVTVLGSPGLGKTRLSREFLAGLAATEAAGTFEIRCDRAGTATFAPVADLVRAAAALDDTDSDDGGSSGRERLTTLLGGIDDVDRVVDGLLGVLGVAPLRSVEETFWAVRRGVEALAASRPLVVVIDDIQWAEPKLLDLAEHLQEWVSDAPVLLVGLARPELRELRPTFVEPGRRVADVLALDGLDARATEELAARLLGSALPRDLVARLPVSTDGNPLFVRELVRMLVDDRVVVRRDDGEWELAIDAEAIEVPPTIQSLLATRVERLPADELRVLECASVVGTEFSVGALRELVGDGPDIPTLLERMRRRELVEPTGSYWGDDPVHRFHHVLIRDAAYRRLLKGARAELHQRVGEWSDASAAGLAGEHEITVAFHFEQAHRFRTELGTADETTDRLGARAAELFEIAARRALEGDDLAAAGALARRALAVLPEGDRDARPGLLLMACESLLASGDVASGAPLVDQLRVAAGPDPQLGAWADCFRAQLVGLTEPEGLVEAEALAAQAATTFDALGDGAGEAKAHQVRALLLARLGRVGEAEAVLDLALGAARAADDRRRVTAVLGAAPQAALFGPSPVARAGGRCLDVVRLLRITTASPSVEATSMRCQAVLEALRGRFDVSRSMLASSRTALEELGLRHGLLETDLFTGMVELIAGDTAAAVAPLRSAYEGLGTLGVGADAGQAAALLATALLAQGEVDEAELMAAESEALAGQNLKTAIAWRTAKAEVLAARGEIDAAVTLAREAVEIAAGTDLVLDHADACVVLADLRDVTGDAVGARAARADALRLYEAKGATVPAERLAEVSPVSDVPVARVAAPGDDVEEVVATFPGETRTAEAENAATRVLEQLRVALNEEDYEMAGRLTADGYVFEDRRGIVAVPDVEALRSDTQGATAQGFVILEPEVIAVRGERLCLRRLVYRTPGGDESPRLVLDEIDPSSRLARSVFFDDDDLPVALAELDRSYYFGEGAPFQRVLAAVGRYRAALDRHDLDRARDRLAPDFVMVDHQPLGFGTGDRDYYLEWTRTDDQGRSGLNAVVFVNDHGLLGVYRQTPVTREGNRYERAGCIVLGVDASDRVHRFEMFAADDFAAALARFDELGAEGTADPRTQLAANAATALMARVIDLCHERRFDEMRALLADDFVREDRRHGVAAPTADGPDEFIRAYSAWFDVGFDTLTMEPLAVRGDHLVLARLEWRSADGRQVPFLAVYELAADDRFVRGVHFDDGDRAAAMEELGARWLGLADERVHAGTRSAMITNRAAEITVAGIAMLNVDPSRARSMAEDFVASGEISPDVRRQDRRRLVASPVMVDGDGWAAEIGAVFSVFDRIEVEPLAVRGDRLVLVRLRCVQDPDFRSTWLAIYEYDDEGRLAHEVDFDESDLAAAVAELDDRFVSGEGAPYAAILTRVREFVAALDARDSEAIAAMSARGARTIDHRRFGMESGEIGFTRGLAEYADIRQVTIATKYLFDANASLASVVMRGVDANGNEVVWLLTVVAAYDAEARFTSGDLYDPEDWDAALARFDELCGRAAAGSATAQPENATTRLIARTLDLMNRSEWDELAAMNVAAEGVVRFDRRRTVSAPTLSDRESFGANAAGIYEVFGVVRPETVAVRGERLALIRLHCGEAPTFTMQLLVVYELDTDGRIVREADFDDDDLDAALDELEERYLAGEGAEHAYVVRRIGDFRNARAARDWDAVEALFAEDYVAVDRRRLGMGQGTRAEYLAASKAMVDLVPDATFVPRSIEIDGDVVLMRTGGSGTSVDGSRSEWEQWVVWRFAAGRVVRGEVFALEDEAAARARFAEQAAQTLTPYIDNHLVRLGQRAQWLGRHAGVVPEFYSADCVLDDRRPGVNAGVVSGAEAVAASIRSGVDVFGLLETEPKAVRGERLALFRWAYVADGGFEAPGLCVMEVDDDDLVCRVTSFDESDLAGAIACLEQRHVELRGDAITPQELTTAVGSRAFNARDWDAMAGVFGRNLRFVTHAPFTTEGGWDDYLAQLRVLVEQVPDVAVVYAKVTTRGRCGLSLLPFSATTPEGSRYSWSMVQVTRMGDDGRIAEFELFDIEQWDDAVVRFEQWTTGELPAERPDPRTPAPENAATRLVQRAARLLWTDLDAALEHFAPDVVGYARESGPTAGASAEEPTRWLDVLASLAATYDEVRFEPLAVRGERLALFRQEFVADGFVTPALLVVELDEHERISRLETFADDDLTGAAELLTARYHVLRGDALTPAERYLDAAFAAWNRRDFAAFAETMEPSFVRTDRAAIGMGVEDRDAYVANMREFAALVPDALPCPAKTYASAGAILTLQRTRGTTVAGSAMAWDVVHVMRAGESGRLVEMVTFDEAQWDEALALFDDWSEAAAGSHVGAGAPTAEWGDAVEEGDDLDGMDADVGPAGDEAGLAADALWSVLDRHAVEVLDRIVTPTVTFDDHLPNGLPSVRSAGALVKVFARLFELAPDTRFAPGPATVAGPAAVLDVEQRSTAPSGTEYRWERIVVVHCTGDGRIDAIECFPGDERAEATERFREWSGEPEVGPVQGLADGVSEAFARRDWEWIRNQISDDIELRDHRSTVSSHVASGADAVVELLQGFADVGFVSMRNEVVEARGERLVLFRRTYRTDAGFELEMLAAAERDETGLIVGMVLFDADDLHAARAELDRRSGGVGDLVG